MPGDAVLSMELRGGADCVIALDAATGGLASFAATIFRRPSRVRRGSAIICCNGLAPLPVALVAPKRLHFRARRNRQPDRERHTEGTADAEGHGQIVTSISVVIHPNRMAQLAIAYH